jgi:hypothetical protein
MDSSLATTFVVHIKQECVQHANLADFYPWLENFLWQAGAFKSFGD